MTPGFNLDTALRCATLCALSYAGDPEAIKEHLGYTRALHSIATGDLFAEFVEGNALEPQILIIRGTATLGGWLANLDALPETPDTTSKFAGRIHTGFLQGFFQLRKWVVGLRKPDQRIQITGHSLGAAIATLYSASFPAEVQLPVYTFGCPRVGNVAFAAAYKPEHFRVVNDLDPIPHVPAGLGYRHVGAEVRLPETAPAGVWRTLESLLLHLRYGLGPTVVAAIQDHYADNYVAALAALTGVKAAAQFDRPQRGNGCWAA